MHLPSEMCSLNPPAAAFFTNPAGYHTRKGMITRLLFGVLSCLIGVPTT
jgi:hypothetical protein